MDQGDSSTTRRQHKLRHVPAVIGGFAIVFALAAWAILAWTAMPSTQAWPERNPSTPTGPPPEMAEPLVFAKLPPETAREINEAIPFAGLGPPSRPFTPAGDIESRGRAIDCLAAAMWYESGDDPAGNLSVGQVVLNRVRHPAFPATVCGVVFQGSERRTGCQFTFTCDGALGRVPAPSTFDRLRTRAASMFGGSVDPSVGLATHYHTDWVHPIWSGQLVKIARVHTHLFFRWKGDWGGPRAQLSRYAGSEPVMPKIGFLSPLHRLSILDPAADPQALALPPPGSGAAGAQVDNSKGTIRITFNPARSGNVQAVTAFEMCQDWAYCEITGVLEGAGPNAPVVFRFLRDRAKGVERVQWDCSRFKRPTTTQCMNPRPGP